MGNKPAISTFSGTLHEGYTKVNSERWAENTLRERLGDSAELIDGFEFFPGHTTKLREIVVFDDAHTMLAPAMVFVQIGDRVMHVNISALNHDFTVVKSIDFMTIEKYEQQLANRQAKLHSRGQLSHDYVADYMDNNVNPEWAFERARSALPPEALSQFGASFMGNLPPTSMIIIQPSTDSRSALYTRGMVKKANEIREKVAEYYNVDYIPVQIDESVEAKARRASAGAD